MDTKNSIAVGSSIRTEMLPDSSVSKTESNKPQKPLIDSCSAFKSWNLSPQTIKILKYGAIGCATGGLLWMILYASGTCRGSAAALATIVIPAFTIAGIGVSFCNKCQKDVNTALIPDVSQDPTPESTQNTTTTNSELNDIKDLESFKNANSHKQLDISQALFKEFHEYYQQNNQDLKGYWNTQNPNRVLLKQLLQVAFPDSQDPDGIDWETWNAINQKAYDLDTELLHDEDSMLNTPFESKIELAFKNFLDPYYSADSRSFIRLFISGIGHYFSPKQEDALNVDQDHDDLDIGDVSQKEFDECHNLETLAKWNFNDQTKKCKELFIEFRKQGRATDSSLIANKESDWDNNPHRLLLEEIIQHSLSATTSNAPAARMHLILKELYDCFDVLARAKKEQQADKVILAQTDAKNFLERNFLQETTTQKAWFAALSNSIHPSNIFHPCDFPFDN